MHKKVTGIGGIFFKATDPDKTRQWYADNLGFSTQKWGTVFDWRHADNPEKEGSTVWNPFKETTDYFAPSTKEFMINLRVENMDWLLGELKKAGVEQIGETQVHEYGKFAHIIDPDGIKIELWEPIDGPDDLAAEE